MSFIKKKKIYSRTCKQEIHSAFVLASDMQDKMPENRSCETQRRKGKGKLSLTMRWKNIRFPTEENGDQAEAEIIQNECLLYRSVDKSMTVIDRFDLFFLLSVTTQAGN